MSSNQEAERNNHTETIVSTLSVGPSAVLISSADLGFQSPETARRVPLVSQIASQLLTLQGAVAHTAMPLASGPTQLLPFSQLFEQGYLAYRDPEFQAVFRDQYVQLEMDRGDAIFFNPALFHAAGDNNTSDINRSANLLQISASWSKAMETVDRGPILRRTWSHIARLVAASQHGVQDPAIKALLNAICDAYSFPTNLDKDPPPANGVSILSGEGMFDLSDTRPALPTVAAR